MRAAREPGALREPVARELERFAAARFRGVAAFVFRIRPRAADAGPLTHHLFRPLVRAQPLEHRLPQAAIVGPLGEADLGHVLRLHPHGAGALLRIHGDGFGHAEGLEQLAELVPHLRIEARAHLAHVVVAVRSLHAHQQRADLPGRALVLDGQEAEDDGLLAGDDLELQPVPRARAHVRRALALGDEALPAAPLRLLERAVPRQLDLLGHLERRLHAREQALQQLAPGLQGPGPEIQSIQPQQIKGHEAQLAALVLEELEARAPLGIQRDDLAVNHSLGDAQPLQRLRDRGEAPGQIIAVAALEGESAPGERGNGAEAVVLHLEEVGLLAGLLGSGQPREHGRPHALEQRLRGRVRTLERALAHGAASLTAPGLHGLGVLGGDVVAGVLGAIQCLETQPLVLAPSHPRADEVPAALELLAVELHHQVALLALLMGLAGRHRVVGALVPEQRVPAAILLVRDAALEAGVGQGVVLGLHREPLRLRIIAGALGEGPTRQGAVDLQPQVIVQPGRVMLVHDEEGLRAASPQRHLRRRLWSLLEVAPGAIGLERGASGLHATNGRHRP